MTAVSTDSSASVQVLISCVPEGAKMLTPMRMMRRHIIRRQGAMPPQKSKRAGEGTSGIDIRYRGERGYTISGTIIGAVPTREIYLRLNRWPGGGQIGFTSARVAGQSHRFEFEGIPDGEYELITRSAVYGDDYSAASPPRRVTINGADLDVRGVEITLVRTTRSPAR
jgi:hypothetical protein